MNILVMPFPFVECPAVLFNQLVKLGKLHDVIELLFNYATKVTILFYICKLSERNLHKIFNFNNLLGFLGSTRF